MTTTTEVRTWTATINLGDGEEIPVTEYTWDVLRETTKAAAIEAGSLLAPGEEARITLYKTTKARGTEKDRTFNVYRDEAGKLRWSR